MLVKDSLKSEGVSGLEFRSVPAITKNETLRRRRAVWFEFYLV